MMFKCILQYVSAYALLALLVSIEVRSRQDKTSRSFIQLSLSVKPPDHNRSSDLDFKDAVGEALKACTTKYVVAAEYTYA
jgi:hypothetical protein